LCGDIYLWYFSSYIYINKRRGLHARKAEPSMQGYGTITEVYWKMHACLVDQYSDQLAKKKLIG